MVRLVLAALVGLDARIERAAASLGAPPGVVFRRVTLPLIAPGVAGGWVLAFITSFDEIVVVLFLAGPEQITLPIRLFEGIRDELTPVVISAAVIMILISVVSMLLVESLRKQSDTRQR